MAKRGSRPKKKASPAPSDRPAAPERTAGKDDAADATGNDDAPDATGETRSPSRMHVWQFQAVRDVLFVAAIVGIFWAGYALRAVTVPLLVALLLAYLFEPLIDRLCRHPKIRRPTAVGGLMAAIGVTLVLSISLVLPLIVGQTTRFVTDMRSGELKQRITGIEGYIPDPYRADFGRFLDVLPGRRPTRSFAPEAETGDDDAGAGAVPPAGEGTGTEAAAGDSAGSDEPAAPYLTREQALAIFDEQVEKRVATEVERALAERDADGEGEEPSGWMRLPAGSVRAITRGVGLIVEVGLLTFLIPFYFFFFSLWYPSVVRFGRELLPQKNRPHVLALLGKMDGVVAGFVRGRIVIAGIMGAMLAMGWMICGVPYAIPLGLVVGIFSIVPYLGGIGLPLAIGFLFFERIGDDGNSNLWWLWVIFWPSLVFVLVQGFEGYVLQPMVFGKATNLDPVTIVVAVLAGGSVMGVYGMLLAIPIAACGRILCTEVLLPRIRAWTRGEVADPLPIERD